MLISKSRIDTSISTTEMSSRTITFAVRLPLGKINVNGWKSVTSFIRSTSSTPSFNLIYLEDFFKFATTNNN